MNNGKKVNNRVPPPKTVPPATRGGKGGHGSTYATRAGSRRRGGLSTPDASGPRSALCTCPCHLPRSLPFLCVNFLSSPVHAGPELERGKRRKRTSGTEKPDQTRSRGTWEMVSAFLTGWGGGKRDLQQKAKFHVLGHVGSSFLGGSFPGPCGFQHTHREVTSPPPARSAVEVGGPSCRHVLRDDRSPARARVQS